MKKTICGISLCLFTAGIASAQTRVAGLAPLPTGCVLPQVAQPQPWHFISESDISKKIRAWRDIDSNDPQNKLLAANSQLASILVNGFFSGAYKAYSAVDDRFTTQLSRQDIINLLTAGSGGFNPANVTKYRIKEDWIYISSTGSMEVRIVGLAPLITIKNVDGSAQDKPAFWVYYPDARNYLAQNKVISKEKPYILNWDQAFNIGFHGDPFRTIETKY